MKALNQILICLTAVGLLSIACTSKKDSSFTITGALQSPSDSSEIIVLVGKITDEIEMKKDTLSAEVNDDGTFTITGEIEEPVDAVLLYGKDEADFILEGGEHYEFIPKSKTTAEPYLKGGSINEVVYAYMGDDTYQAKRRQTNEFMDTAFSGPRKSEQELIELRKQMGQLFEEYLKIESDHIESVIQGDYPDETKLFVLKNAREYDGEQKLALVNDYAKQIGETNQVKYKRKKYEERVIKDQIIASVKPGKPFKDVIGKDLNGKEMSLAKTVANNEYTLLEVWASWCGPCRGEIPHLKEAYEKYHKKGFEIYGVSIDKSEDKWLKALEQEQLPWPGVMVEGAFKNPYVKDYGIFGIPASFLIAKDGTIVADVKTLRGSDLEKTLEKHFGS